MRSIRLLAFGFVLLALPLAGLTGCVRSKMVVTSDPPGATVTKNGINLGETPVEQPFTWYWYYDFVAQKEGYAPAWKRERFRAPVYLWPGLDLVMEMMPFYVTDTKYVHLELQQLDERPRPLIVGSTNESLPARNP